MQTSLLRLCAVFLLASIGMSTAHPVFQKHFNRIVNANPCLKKCMDQATADDVELSLLKTANVSAYLLNVESICSTISAARTCISACGVESNPFTLESTTIICSPQSLAEIATITPCLQQQGNDIMDECQQQCGDYDQLNAEVEQLTTAMHPEVNEPHKLTQAMGKINEACGSLKCSDRCVSKAMSEQCPSPNGQNAGAVLKTLIERVLVAQRRDLERMQLVDAMAQAVPTQCNYMFLPEVMFNATKDELAMAVIAETHRNEQMKKQAAMLTQGSQDADKRHQLHTTLSQLQSQLIQKQMDLLGMQERNIQKESRKLDLELQMLQQKRLQAAANDEGMAMNKQF